MNTKQHTTMTDKLRQAIADSGLPMLTIATETGIQRASLIRFARGDQSLRLDVADRLAAYFGLRLTPDPEAVPPTPENLARPILAKTKARAKGKVK